jgi:hypothetical protein
VRLLASLLSLWCLFVFRTRGPSSWLAWLLVGLLGCLVLGWARLLGADQRAQLRLDYLRRSVSDVRAQVTCIGSEGDAAVVMRWARSAKQLHCPERGCTGWRL